jgi:hypothetical protein
MDAIVQVKHPDTDSWVNATIVMARGAKVTVKITHNNEIVTVHARNVRPVSPAKQTR